MSKSAGSVERVRAAAAAAGLAIEIVEMPASTRTAEEAATACGCPVGAIVKSLIFQGRDSGALWLVCVSGANQVDLAKVADACGEPLDRADPKDVRARTGFAIGGVAPIGHLEAPRVIFDRDLLDHAFVWAAAGAPQSVFNIAPADLARVTSATVLRVSG